MKKLRALLAWTMIAMLLTVALGSALAEANAEAPVPDESSEQQGFFALWNADAPALKALIDYVETVTDEESEYYIPPVDRIATFDMDGTLCAELNPTYLE